MFRILLFSLSLSLVACASKPAQQAERAALHLSIGTAHLKKGNYPEAMSELREAERLNPKNPQIQNNLALAYYVREHFKQAEIHFEKALQANPSFTEARNNLGKMQTERGLYGDAIQHLKVAAEDLTYKHPERSYTNLGIAYFKNGQYSLAQESLTRALRIRPQNCSAFNYYARTLFELSSYEEAAAAFDGAIRICGKANLPEPHYFAALSYTKLGQREEAIARLEKLIENHPSTEYSQKARAMLEMLK